MDQLARVFFLVNIGNNTSSSLYLSSFLILYSNNTRWKFHRRI
ncbi:hypothetical protein QN277_002034 [Acacia crassicarpa]|uniref:Uncharacterized protein n=1 Tax=Acacia crassicarpa TaxID=499986 RepID=A0AAE1NA10_9FABA|nr:hypothetical protein QN277_002034 [Acacia crassicarpa]